MFFQKMLFFFVLWGALCAKDSVCVYIPARLHSTRIEQKLLKEIDGISVIQRTYERARWIKNKDRICVLTDSPKIGALIGKDALVIPKNYTNGTERICDAIFNLHPAKEEIIVNVQGDEPFLDPSHVDYAVEKFLSHKDDPHLGAVFLHYKMPVEKASFPSKIKVVVDTQNRLLYGSRSVIPYGKTDHYLGRVGVMVYRSSALKKFWRHKNTFLQMTEDLEWLKLLELGYTVRSFPVPSRVEQDVNTLSELQELEAKYTKPRIFLIRSGGFNPFFIEKTHQLWKVRDNDLVVRCKNTTENNLDLFQGRVDLAFLRFQKPYIDHKFTAIKYTGENQKETKGIFVPPHKFGMQKQLSCDLSQFAKINNFEKFELLDIDWATEQYKENLNLTVKARQVPSLGLLAIFYLRKHFPDHLLVLVDFTFKGSHYHAWDQEKKFAESLEEQGVLIRLLQG